MHIKYEEIFYFIFLIIADRRKLCEWWVVTAVLSAWTLHNQQRMSLTYSCLKNALCTLEGEVALSIQESGIGQSDLFLCVVWVLLSRSFLPSLSSMFGCRSLTAEQELFPSLLEVTIYFPNSCKRRYCCSDSGDNYTFVLWKWLGAQVKRTGKTSIC